MKKTIIALLALGGVALADSYTTLADVTTVTSTNATANFSDNEALEATLVLTLNVENFGADLGTSTGNSSNHFIATLGGKWEDGAVGKLGAVTWGNGTYNGVQGYWAKGANDASKGNGHVGLNNIFSDSPINWEEVVAASLVMSYKAPAGYADSTNKDSMPWVFAFSYRDVDGKVTTFSGAKNDLLHFGATNTFTVTGLTVESNYVTAYTLYANGTDEAGAAALSAARVVPEPTTATLSLLALAGLAARRRRR